MDGLKLNPKYTIITQVLRDKETMDGIIDQRVSFDDGYLIKEISHKLMNTCNSHIRDALIKLGWTPPKEEIKEN